MAIKGLKGVLSNLSKFGNDAKKSVEIITGIVAENIVSDAKFLAPLDNGDLKQSIHLVEMDKYSYKIVAGAPYAAYMEFGTGGLVDVPIELKDVAIQFKGKGIRQVNIEPRPYLYPAWKKGQKDYVKDLKDELKTLTKKYN